MKSNDKNKSDGSARGLSVKELREKFIRELNEDAEKFFPPSGPGGSSGGTNS